jgi:hypothetical protein
MVAMAAFAAATLAACSHSSLQQSLLPAQPAAQSPAFHAPGTITQEELTVMQSPRYRACETAPRGYESCYAILSNASVSPNLAPSASCLHLPGCYLPVDLQGAYGVTGAAKSRGKGVTVALVDAYGYTGGYKGAATDLATYRKFAGLPACGKGCFIVVNQAGGTKLPKPGSGSLAGWQGEEMLDVDMVSAICPKCKILLVQAASSSTTDLLKGEATALKKADYVSNSWGSVEQAAAYSLFDTHPGKVITASAGDDGAGVPPSQYNGAPESQPCGFTGVVCVGGTSLIVNNAVYASETVWQDFHYKYKGKVYNVGATGSGCSALVAKPSWQNDTGCTMRSATDISADADPITGVVIACTPCSSSASNGLIGGVGGTSASAPMIAAMYALAGNAGSIGSAPQTIWTSSAGNFHDVTKGFNDAAHMNPPLSTGDKRTGLICTKAIAYICTAGPGYDGPTGLGALYPMNRTAIFAVAMTMGLLAVCAAAAPSRDGASIVDSGSTNTAAYTIKVWSDGTAEVSSKSFTIAPSLAARFFADLKAARDGKAAGEHCMKSASFGTSTHVLWHGWTSPDLDCPPSDKLTSAIVNDVSAIRAAGKVTAAPLRGMFPGGPPRVIVSPLPT